MNTVLISNGIDFYDITESIPKLINHWTSNGVKGDEIDAIRALMNEFNCHQYVEGKDYYEATKRLIEQENI